MKQVTLFFALFLSALCCSEVYANEHVSKKATEDNVICCECKVKTTFLENYSKEFQLGQIYLPLVKVEVEQKDGGLMYLTIRNVVYENLLCARGIGNIICETTIDATGHFSGAVTAFSEGDLDGYDSWDGLEYVFTYGDAGEIEGTYSEDKFEAVVSIWVENPMMGYGEFTHRITLTKSEFPDNTYSRSVTAGNYGTIVLPFKPEHINGIAHIYSLKGKKLDDKGQIEYFVLKEETEMEAGVPYIFLSDADEIAASAPADAERAIVPKNRYPLPGHVDQIGNNGLQGTYETKHTYDLGYTSYYDDDFGEHEEYVPYTVYLLSNNRVVKAGSGSTIGEYRAYILSDYVPTITDVAGAKGIRLSMDDASGIGLVHQEVGSRSDIFDLTGRKLPNLRKGINIVNGKKIVK